MSCIYIGLYGKELKPAVCDRPCDGDYCVEHQKLIEAVDELDRELQETIRERRTRN